MDPWLIVLVGIGGLIGAVLRFAVSGATTTDRFPYGTLIVNVVGSFLLGLILFSYAYHGQISTEWRVFFGIGILGAFTTMSTFSMETVSFLEESEYLKASANIVLNVAGSIGAVILSRVVILAAGR
jgi:CrcB protein